VPFPSPHAPIIPNDEFDGKSQAGPYGDFVVQTDDACGRILAAIEQIGQMENTIVVFSADNGSEYYAYARDDKFDHWSSAPFRGVKRDIYEGGHHVPFLVRWPGVTKAGAVSDALISQVDFMATVASLVGYELPRNAAEDSHDFLPYLRGQTKAGPRRSMVHNTYANRYAVREGDWVLVDTKTGDERPVPAAWNKKHNQPPDDDAPSELYNLRQDPQQRRNLAAKHPERVQALQALLRTLREKGYSAPRLDVQ
jgi:arylsulfatase A